MACLRTDTSHAYDQLCRPLGGQPTVVWRTRVHRNRTEHIHTANRENTMTATAVIDRDTVHARLLAAFAELGIEEAEITPDTQLRADLDIDSAELVEIVASLAGGKAPDGKALKDVRTVAQLTGFLQQHQI
ncbi:phosphopantetheine-binding protein [Streptomyces sp. LHD-70]|uniref:acyl carrier protein n=1 Tax=Streptomyces sp. LHD-70 TaxID=3072140 RepID=UPI00280E44B4|nr:phosphopantetheine-binding protein [Streptomyces sp. LHD-70]MDQ8705983.1 phosphopantetheine-binding protein [Streptomyces sp. LHD-70]